MSGKSKKKYTLKILRSNIGTAQKKYRNLKDSSLTNVNIRAWAKEITWVKFWVSFKEKESFFKLWFFHLYVF